MEELISIIVPIYNTDCYVIKCIESLLAQSYSNIEIILIDDGSTDNCGKICDEYHLKDNRIKTIHKENKGASSARNCGLKMAKGNLISFVDSDDYIEKNFLKILYDLLKGSNSDISVVSYYKIEDNTKKAYRNSDKISIFTRESAVEELLIDKDIQNFVWNKLYYAELFRNIKFPEDNIYDDINIMYTLFKKSKQIIYKEQPLYNYTYRTDSVINNNNHIKFEDALKSIKIRYNEVKFDFPELQQVNSYSLILWVVRIYKFMALANDRNIKIIKNNIDLITSCFNKNTKFIINKLDNDKLLTLFIILWNPDKGLDILRILYGK